MIVKYLTKVCCELCWDTLGLQYSTDTYLSIGEDLAVHLAPAHEDLAGEDRDAGEDAANVHAGHAPPLLGRNY